MPHPRTHAQVRMQGTQTFNRGDREDASYCSHCAGSGSHSTIIAPVIDETVSGNCTTSESHDDPPTIIRTTGNSYCARAESHRPPAVTPSDEIFELDSSGNLVFLSPTARILWFANHLPAGSLCPICLVEINIDVSWDDTVIGSENTVTFHSGCEPSAEVHGYHKACLESWGVHEDCAVCRRQSTVAVGVDCGCPKCSAQKSVNFDNLSNPNHAANHNVDSDLTCPGSCLDCCCCLSFGLVLGNAVGAPLALAATSSSTSPQSCCCIIPLENAPFLPSNQIFCSICGLICGTGGGSTLVSSKFLQTRCYDQYCPSTFWPRYSNCAGITKSVKDKRLLGKLLTDKCCWEETPLHQTRCCRLCLGREV